MDMKIDVYNDPCFMLSDAKLHIFVFNVPKRTIYDWVVGSKNYKPLIEIAQKSPPRLSFINLVELYVLASIRRKFHIPMPYVRSAVEFVNKELGSKHPLAEHRFETDGLRIFFEHLGGLYDISKGVQQSFDFVKTYLHRIEYSQSGLPLKFYPFTRLDKHEDDKTPMCVTINPRICFGRPILESISVPVEIISQRYWAGESHDSLINEYNITSEELDEAIRVGRYYHLEAA
jgi:uncharacterized protein (DUF433 family)